MFGQYLVTSGRMWEHVLVQDEYVDRGGVGAMNVVLGKRTRGSSSSSSSRHS